MAEIKEFKLSEEAIEVLTPIATYHFASKTLYILEFQLANGGVCFPKLFTFKGNLGINIESGRTGYPSLRVEVKKGLCEKTDFSKPIECNSGILTVANISDVVFLYQ